MGSGEKQSFDPDERSKVSQSVHSKATSFRVNNYRINVKAKHGGLLILVRSGHFCSTKRTLSMFLEPAK